MKFSNKDIEHALICCSHSDCDNCPFYGEIEDCEVELPEQALKLVNHYRLRTENLKGEIKLLSRELKSMKNRMRKLYDEMARLARMTVLCDKVDKDGNFTVYEGEL